MRKTYIQSTIAELFFLRVKARLVVIDPIMSVMGGTDTYKDSEVRRVLGPLKKLAEEMGVTIIIVRHLTKTETANPLHRGQGSVGFIGLVRGALTVMKDPDDEEKRLLVPFKNSLGPLMTPMSFQITGDPNGNEPGIITWLGPSEH